MATILLLIFYLLSCLCLFSSCPTFYWSNLVFCVISFYFHYWLISYIYIFNCCFVIHNLHFLLIALEATILWVVAEAKEALQSFPYLTKGRAFWEWYCHKFPPWGSFTASKEANPQHWDEKLHRQTLLQTIRPAISLPKSPSFFHRHPFLSLAFFYELVYKPLFPAVQWDSSSNAPACMCK